MWDISNSCATYASHSRQIDERQVQHVGRVDTQTNGGVRDALHLSGRAVGLALDLDSNLIKVVEVLVGLVQELSPFTQFRCERERERERERVSE